METYKSPKWRFWRLIRLQTFLKCADSRVSILETYKSPFWRRIRLHLFCVYFQCPEKSRPEKIGIPSSGWNTTKIFIFVCKNCKKMEILDLPKQGDFDSYT